MGDPIFGLVLRKTDEESRPIVAADLSTIGIIGPAPDADASAFPANTPVLVYSNNTTLMTKLGTRGYLQDALTGIQDQMAETQFAARCVVIRTVEGVDADPAMKTQKTINNIVGSPISQTGVYAFLKSASLLTVTPRLICAPGYTGPLTTSVDSVELVPSPPATGYVEGQTYNLTFSGGGDNAVQATATAVGQADGTLGAVTITSPGAWYDTAPTVSVDPAGKRVTVAVVDEGGSGYTVGDTITLNNGVVLTVATASESPTGAVLTADITDPGMIDWDATNPTNPQEQVSSSGGGTGASFTLTWTLYTEANYVTTIASGANPIIAALNGVLNQLLGHAVVESSGTSQANDNDWRETISSGRIIAVSGGCKVLDSTTALTVYRPIASRILGIAVRRDHEKGAPFHSWANQAVQGILGPQRAITYSLTDDANEAQALLANNIGVVVRGELGNEFAIAQAGYIFIGTDNCGEDELWRFYNMQRGRDYIHLTLLRSMRYYLGRYNISFHTVQAICNGMEMLLRDLLADGHILGYKVAFNPAKNSADEIRMGHLVVGFLAEEAAPLRKLTIESARYRAAVDALIAQLATQLSFAA